MRRILELQSCERVGRVGRTSHYMNDKFNFSSWQTSTHTDGHRPDRPFHNFRISKSGGRQILCSLRTSSDGFRGSKVVTGFGRCSIWISWQSSLHQQNVNCPFNSFLHLFVYFRDQGEVLNLKRMIVKILVEEKSPRKRWQKAARMILMGN